jgi:hypothetical protein
MHKLAAFALAIVRPGFTGFVATAASRTAVAGANQFDG